ERNTFRNMGGAGLLFYSGVQMTTIVGNVFKDISTSGISLDATFLTYWFPPVSPDPQTIVRDNVVQNNYIVRAGRDYKGSAGIHAMYVQNHVFEHNELEDLPWTGITYGTAGHATSDETILRNNIIRYNKLHGVCTLMSDCAGVYQQSNQP